MELLSPAHFHQYAPHRRAEELGSEGPFQHVDGRPTVEQDRPYRAAYPVTNLFVAWRLTTAKERQHAHRSMIPQSGFRFSEGLSPQKQDHAPSISWSVMTIRREVITL